MPLSLSAVQTILVSRSRAVLVRVGLSTETAEPNPDLADPIATALALAGRTLEDFSAPADGDLAAVPVADYAKVLDLAELRLKENILGNWDLYTNSATDRSVNYGEGRASLEREVARLQKKLEVEIGLGLGTLGAGTIRVKITGASLTGGDF